MKRFTILVSSLSLAAGLGFVAPAFSQAVPPTAMLTKVDPLTLETGWRASEIIGAQVYNDAGEEIGKLEDMIVTPQDTVPYVVVSVGGFLGMGAHHVAVAASSMEFVGEKLTLHGATKDSLKALPNFDFGS